jgi:hypothetical protein
MIWDQTVRRAPGDFSFIALKRFVGKAICVDSLVSQGLGEGRSYEAIPKKDHARAESPRTQIICFLFAVAAPLPQPLPKGGEQTLFSI